MKKKVIIGIAILMIMVGILCGCQGKAVYTVSGVLEKVENADDIFWDYIVYLEDSAPLKFDNTDGFDWKSELEQNYIGKNIEITIRESGGSVSYTRIISVKVIEI